MTCTGLGKGTQDLTHNRVKPSGGASLPSLHTLALTVIDIIIAQTNRAARSFSRGTMATRRGPYHATHYR